MIDVVLLCYLLSFGCFCINPLVCSLFCNFCWFALFTFLFSEVYLFCFYFSLLLATCFFFRKKLFNWYTHTSWATWCLNFCTALCLHNEDDIYSVNECGFCFVGWFVYLFWLLLLLRLLCMWVLSTVGEKPKTEKPIEWWLFCFSFEACDSECLIVVVNI